MSKKFLLVTLLLTSSLAVCSDSDQNILEPDKPSKTPNYWKMTNIASIAAIGSGAVLYYAYGDYSELQQNTFLLAKKACLYFYPNLPTDLMEAAIRDYLTPSRVEYWYRNVRFLNNYCHVESLIELKSALKSVAKQYFPSALDGILQDIPADLITAWKSEDSMETAAEVLKLILYVLAPIPNPA